MAYVDLNPIRANIATTPESSDHTSIKARLQGARAIKGLNAAIKKLVGTNELNHFNTPLRPLTRFAQRGATNPLPIRERDYFTLVDETGRVTVQGKRGRINPSLSPILERIGISMDEWEQASSAFRRSKRIGRTRRTA